VNENGLQRKSLPPTELVIHASSVSNVSTTDPSAVLWTTTRPVPRELGREENVIRICVSAGKSLAPLGGNVTTAPIIDGMNHTASAKEVTALKMR
jgi:hypothetical protein